MNELTLNQEYQCTNPSIMVRLINIDGAPAGMAEVAMEDGSTMFVFQSELIHQVPCEILGCGKQASEAQMRIFRLGGAPVKCCPECWDAMEIPRDCRDTADLAQHNNELTNR
jgi:hypothetical protein